MFHFIIDIEATCWDGYHPNHEQEIIEIAGILLNGYGEEVDTFESMVRPTINPTLSSFCKELTNITQEEVSRARTFSEVSIGLEDWLEAHDAFENCNLYSWGKFDREIIIAEYHRLDDEPIFYLNHLNLKAAYKRMKGLDKKVGLQKALRLEGLEFEGEAHRAMPDAYNLCKLYKKYLYEWITD